MIMRMSAVSSITRTFFAPLAKAWALDGWAVESRASGFCSTLAEIMAGRLTGTGACRLGLGQQFRGKVQAPNPLASLGLQSGLRFAPYPVAISSQKHTSSRPLSAN